MNKKDIIEKIYPLLLKEFPNKIKKTEDGYKYECIYCGEDNLNAVTTLEEMSTCTNEKCKAYQKEFSILGFVGKNKKGYEGQPVGQILQMLVDEYNLEGEKKLDDNIDYFSKLVQYGFCFSKDARYGDSMCKEHGYLFKNIEECPTCNRLTQTTTGKEAISGGWTKQENRDPKQAKEWIKNGFNIAIRTGMVSNATAIDFDAGIPEELEKVLGDTFIQKTTKGYHYVYQYEDDLPSIAYKDLHIDLLNNNKKFTIYPSKPGGKERKIINDMAPVKMPIEVKNYLISQMTATQKRRRDALLKKMGKAESVKKSVDTGILDIPELKDYNFDIKALGEHGGRNVVMTSIMGVMRRRFSFKDCVYIGKYINDNFFSPSLDYFEIEKIFDSIEGMIDVDNHELREKICDYMVKVKVASKQDIVMMLSSSHNDKFKESERIDVVLSEMVEENKLLRRSNNYEYYNAPVFTDKWDEEEEDFDWQLKYFPNSTLTQRSTILIAGKTGTGKTHIAMNIIKELVDKGLKPNYLSTEIDSKYSKIAKTMGLKQGDFGFARCSDVRKVQFPKNSFMVIDWITAPDGDYSQLEVQFKDIKDKQLESNAFVVVFMQAKEDGSLFAPNLTKNYCTDVYQFGFEKSDSGEDDRRNSSFKPLKIRDALEGVASPFVRISTKFNTKKKKLEVLKDAIESENGGPHSVNTFSKCNLERVNNGGIDFNDAVEYKL